MWKTKLRANSKNIFEMIWVLCNRNQMWTNFVCSRVLVNRCFGIAFDSSKGIMHSFSFSFMHFLWFLPKLWLFSTTRKQSLDININFRLKSRIYILSVVISLTTHNVFTVTVLCLEIIIIYLFFVFGTIEHDFQSIKAYIN